MKRNMRRLAAFAAALLMMSAAAPAYAAEGDALTDADFSGYLFKLRDGLPAVALMSDGEGELPQGIEALPFDCFKADDMGTLAELTEAGWIEYIEPNYRVELVEVPNDPGYANVDQQWYLDMLGMNEAWTRGLDGSGVTVGIVDSGLYPAHEDIDYSRVLRGYNYYDGNDDTTDERGHGTRVTGIIAAIANNRLGIAGIAPMVSIIPLKCFGDDNDGSSVADIMNTIQGGIDKRCDILNMSLAAYGYSTPLHAAVVAASEQGIIMIAAVGNGKKLDGGGFDYTVLGYPAAYPEVIGVGAVTKDSKHSSFSQTNTSVHVVAPGSSIYSTTKEGGYGPDSGTSFSCPMVAGIAALAKQAYPWITGTQLAGFLAITAENLGDPGWDREYGYGLVNIPALFAKLDDVADHRPTYLPVADGIELSAPYQYMRCGEGENVAVVAAGFDGEGRMLAAEVQNFVTGEQGRIDVTGLILDLKDVPDRLELYFLDPDSFAPVGDKFSYRINA